MSKKEVKYSRDKLIKSAKFKGRKDLICALVGEDEALTMSELSQKINKFLKGEK